MNKIKFINFPLIVIILAFSFLMINAQNGNNLDESPNDASNKRPRQNRLVELLDLTSDQIQQIRQINQDQRILMREAREKQRMARTNLDQAVYAEVVDEAAIQLRLQELITAQAEVSKIRITTELKVRKVLSPEQLQKFRTIRMQFMNRPQDRGNRGEDSQKNRPSRRLKQKQPN